MKHLEEITSKKLKEGKVFNLTNENYQMKIGDDDIRMARVFHEPRFDWYVIMFNGATIYCGGSFTYFKRRLKKLIQDWTLTMDTEVEF